MPAKGQSQTEETKKKIAEALTKNKAKVSSVPRSKEAQALYSAYSKSKEKTQEMRAKIESLRIARKALSRKKASRSQRAAITSQMKAIREKMKQEVLARREIVQKAKAAKRVKRAKLTIEKSKLRTQKLQNIERKAQERLRKATTPEAKQRLKEYLVRISDAFTRQARIVSSAKTIISQKGMVAKKRNGSFDFEEQFSFFGERVYDPYRALTEQEERADLEAINEKFNELESKLENELVGVFNEQIDPLLKKAEKAIQERDLDAVDALLLLYFFKIRKSIDTTAKQAYAVGKSHASKELKVSEPPTSSESSKVRSAESEQFAKVYTTELENEAKSLARNAITSGATATVAVVAIREVLRKRASEIISGLSGTVPGLNFNRGRKQVFFDNLDKITHFQRSEVLDTRTCNLCLTLDKRIVRADDPFANLDTIHTYCRGTWVPILESDETPKASNVGLPKTVRESFETVDGRPVVNKFKQIKNPTNTKENPEAKAEIEKRLKK